MKQFYKVNIFRFVDICEANVFGVKLLRGNQFALLPAIASAASIHVDIVTLGCVCMQLIINVKKKNKLCENIRNVCATNNDDMVDIGYFQEAI